jgi:hypothetical protein
MKKWTYWIITLIFFVLFALPASSSQNGTTGFSGVFALNPVGSPADLSQTLRDGQLVDSSLTNSVISPVSSQIYSKNIAASDSHTPITIKLTQSKIPLVNEETILHFEVNSIFDAPETTVKIILPPNVKLITGSLERTIDLHANTPESFEVTIKFTQPGDFKITASAHKVIDKDNSWGDMDVLYLTIGNVQKYQALDLFSMQNMHNLDQNNLLIKV